jgi:hypothetical protein
MPKSLGCETAVHRLGIGRVRGSGCFEEMNGAIGDTEGSGWNGTRCSVQTLQRSKEEDGRRAWDGWGLA